jgi:hypothetical protein
MPAKNVRVDAAPAAGAVAAGPIGTALPTDAATALDAAYKSVGLLGSDGVNLTPSMSSEDVTDSNGNVVLTIESGYKTEFGFPMLETSAATLSFYHDAANVTVTPGTSGAPDLVTVQGGAPIFDHSVVIISTIFNGLRKRIVFPDAKITGRDAVNISGTAATVRPVTLTAYPFDDEGHTYIEYTEVPPAA